MLSVSKWGLLLSGAAVVVTGFATAADAQSRRDRNRSNQQQQQPAAPATPQVSRPFSTAYLPVNTAINAGNLAAADAGLPALQAAATTPYERFIAAQTEYRIAVAQNNAARQATALYAMADSEGAPAADAPRVHFGAGTTAYNAQDYANAVRRFERAIALNSTGENLPALYAVSLMRSNQFDRAMTYTRQQIAAGNSGGPRPAENFLSLVAQQLQNANRNAELMEMLGVRARLYPTPDNVRILGSIMLRSSDTNAAMSLDVLRTLLAGGGMSTGNAANNRRLLVDYVNTAATANLPGEAVAAIRAGRTSGVIPANDTFFNEQFNTQNAEVASDRSSLAGSARAAANDAAARTATLTGDAYLSYGDYADAERLYQMALTKTGADTHQLNLRIGMARFRAGNFAGAQQVLQTVQGARAPLAGVWLALIDARNAPPPPAAPPAAPAPAPAAPRTN
jgi:tetratricopeptide (TPR) repeat protein